MRGSLREEIDSYVARDPALRSRLEVVFCYPGFHALLFHRVSSWLWRRRLKFWGRFVSHLGRMFSGIEIHPGARIGRRLFIDHGMGVVIGETAEIGDDVTLYQGVTLGGTSLEKGKRHPTLENGVICGSGAQILGPFTVGAGARIGANAVVLSDVPAGVTMVGIPAKVAKARSRDAVEPSFDAYGIPEGLSDPVARTIEGLLEEIHRLSARVEALETEVETRRGDDEPRLRVGATRQ
jgi:serine O-acetyltransferase